MPINRESVQNKIRDLGFVVFDGAHDYDIQIVGLRRRPSLPPRADGKRQFDDRLCMIFKKGGVWQFYSWPITTDPQGHYLKDPVSKAGAAIIASPQQARGVWSVGTFAKGKPWEHEALVQVGDFQTWHDANKDTVVDFGGALATSHSTSGLCMHRNIGDSAGCQEFEDNKHDFPEAMSFCHAQINAGLGNHFTYTLIDWPAEDFVVA
jgi:hypothetical protein